MTSLAIAPCSQGCNTHASYMLQSGMPFSDASSGRGKSSLETGLQAVSLSPYCTGLAAQQSQRQDCPPLHGYAIVPSAFRLQVSPSTSGIFLEMPPDYIGDTSVRHMAHMRFCTRYTCLASLRQGSSRQAPLMSSVALEDDVFLSAMLLVLYLPYSRVYVSISVTLHDGLGFLDHRHPCSIGWSLLASSTCQQEPAWGSTVPKSRLSLC